MKLQFKILALAAGLSALTGTMPLTAQTAAAQAKIPFAFEVQQKTMPAGTYIVRQQYGSILEIYDTRGHGVFLNAPVMRTVDPNQPKMTFACAGSDCVLSNVSFPGSATGYGISQEALKKNLTHKMGFSSMIEVRLTGR